MKVPVLFALSLAAPAWGVTSNYFPLHTGDLWVYETAGSRCCRPLIVEVIGTGVFNGNGYFQLHSSAGVRDSWVRTTADGTVVAYDSATDQESARYVFSADVSERGPYSGPAGVFDDAVTIAYPVVAETGVVREVLAAGVGLVQRIENYPNGGVATYQLVYARVGGIAWRADTQGATGIAGRVFRGPTCPVQRPDDPACGDQPFQTVLRVLASDGSRELAIAASDANGYFRIVLPPGDYLLTNQNSNGSKFPSTVPQVISVPDDGFASVTVRLDSGIR